MNNAGYQGYGGGGGYYAGSGGGGAQQGQQQFNANQFGQPQGQQQHQPQPGNAQQWQYPPQQQQGGGYGQPQGGGFGVPQQQQQQQQQQQSGGFAQQQPGMYNQQQPQQQPQQYWNPAMSAAAMGMMTQLAAGQGFAPGIANDMITDQGKKFIETNFLPGLNTVMMTLRPYFAVDNGYVLQKIKKILFPFMTKQWNRKVREML